MPKLIATAVFPYDKRALQPGDEFEAEAAHVGFLIGSKQAKHPASDGQVSDNQGDVPARHVAVARPPAQHSLISRTAAPNSGKPSSRRQPTRRSAQ